jgi:hypothetical protein
MSLCIRASYTESSLQLNGTWVLTAKTSYGTGIELTFDRCQAEEIGRQISERTDRSGRSTILLRLVVEGDQLGIDAARWVEALKHSPFNGDRS